MELCALFFYCAPACLAIGSLPSETDQATSSIYVHMNVYNHPHNHPPTDSYSEQRTPTASPSSFTALAAGVHNEIRSLFDEAFCWQNPSRGSSVGRFDWILGRWTRRVAASSSSRSTVRRNKIVPLVYVTFCRLLFCLWGDDEWILFPSSFSIVRPSGLFGRTKPTNDGGGGSDRWRGQRGE